MSVLRYGRRGLCVSGEMSAIAVRVGRLEPLLLDGLTLGDVDAQGHFGEIPPGRRTNAGPQECGVFYRELRSGGEVVGGVVRAAPRGTGSLGVASPACERYRLYEGPINGACS